MKKLLLILLIFFSFGIYNTYANIDNFLLDNDAPTNIWYNANSAKYTYQSITTSPDATALSSIDIRVRKNGNWQNIYARVRDAINWNILYTSTDIALTSNISSFSSVHNFELWNISVTPNTKYYFEFYSTGFSTSSYIDVFGKHSGVYAYWHAYKDSTIYASADIHFLLYEQTWPPTLELTQTGALYVREDGEGVDLLFLEVNTDVSGQFQIYDDQVNLLDSWTMGSFSGGFIPYNFLNDDLLFNFTQPLDYTINVQLENLGIPGDIIHLNYEINYSLDTEYTDPDPELFNPVTSGYEFLESGFILHNFIPNNGFNGGELYFEILAPNPTGTGTVVLETNRIGHYSIDGNGYGFDSAVRINYPYHETPGVYGVKAIYEVDNITYYIFGDSYESYTITLPEIRSEFDQDLFFCDFDDSGDLSPEEQATCDGKVNMFFIDDIGRLFIWIKRFFKELMEIWNVQPVEWGAFFLPSANAQEYVSDTVVFSMNLENKNILTDVYKFIKWFIIFTFLILWLILMIVLLKKDS